mgnify:CR=1 FL=1
MRPFDSIDDFCSAVTLLSPEVTDRAVNELSRKVILRFRSARERSRSYREFTIPKKGGGERTITAPTGYLKDILTCIGGLLDGIYEPSACAMGFVRGRSVLTNASAHLGKEYLINVDLKDFFPSIGAPKVESALVRLGVDPLTARLVSTLCCIPVERDGKIINVLPQGSPASPVLSNIACSAMDTRMEEMAASFGFTYTRYADDLSFSRERPMYADEAALFWDRLRRTRGRLAYAAMVRGKDDPAVRALRRRLRRVMYIYKQSTQACTS